MQQYVAVRGGVLPWPSEPWTGDDELTWMYSLRAGVKHLRNGAKSTAAEVVLTSALSQIGHASTPFFFKWINNKEIAAGVTPGIRVA